MTLPPLPACWRRPILAATLAAAAFATGCASLQGQQPAAGDGAAPAGGDTRPAQPIVAPPPTAASPAAPAAAPAEAPIVLAPLQPRMRLDPEQDAARSDLWQRLRDRYAMPDLDGDLVRKWEAWYAARPDYVQRMAERGGRYLFHIVEEIETRGLPGDLALLPFIESAFNPQAMSRARASGMWQFMPATGRDFELRQNLFRDDRRAVLASTRAALDYLQQLHAQFGDWHLALAAYNWGQGNVQRAIARNRKAGLPTDYASLRMPAETRNYVPKLQAVKNIVRSPESFALQLPVLENHPYFLTVAIERDIDVDLAAQLSGLPLEDFRQLNPQHNKPVILAAGTPQVLLPYDNANRFLRELALHDGPLASWTAWVAPKTLRPAEAARLVGTSEARLREVNRIPARMLVKAGSTLLVPRAADGGDDVAVHIADTATVAFTAERRPLRRLVIKAGSQGDSVAAVARRYRVSASQVATWNKVGLRARFRPGQQIVLMLPPRGAAVRPKARTAKAAKATPPAAAAKANRPARAAQAPAAPPRAAGAAGSPRARAAQTEPR